MSNTKERERQFHNKRYINDKRKVLSGVYTFAQSSKSLFYKMLTNIGSGDKVLEIGCGIGTYPIEFNRISNNREYALRQN